MPGSKEIATLIEQDAIMRDVTDNTSVSHSKDPSSRPPYIFPSTSDTSNASTLADNQIRIFCFILGRSENSFSVKVERDKTVEDLRNAIIDKENLTPDGLQLFKLQTVQITNAEWRILYNDELLQQHFDLPLQRGIHIVIYYPSRSQKYTLSCPSDGDHAVKKVRQQGDIVHRKWLVNGEIWPFDIPGCYYLDILKQKATQECLRAVDESRFVLLSGPRASGKSTRLIFLKFRLKSLGYKVNFVTFQYLTEQDTLESFWGIFSLCSQGIDEKISSPRDFLRCFAAGGNKPPVVLLIDEVSSLHNARPAVRDSFLNVFRAVRNSQGDFVIKSIICAGIYSLTYLCTSDKPASPFDAGIHIQNENFTLEEVGQLFREFAQDRKIQISNDVVEDIFNKTNGHAGLVCLCGRTIEENMGTLVIDRILSKEAWRAYPIHELYGTISRHNKFGSMLTSLSDPKIDPAVPLLLRRIMGFLDNIEVNDDERETADHLTSEGVFVKLHPDQLYYRMSSPLVDGLLRTELLRVLYPLKPPGPPPRRDDRSLDVIETLAIALALFDRQHMANACQMSYKSSGRVIVDNQEKCPVPHESVYDTELMRILSNWLSPFAWRVVGQCRMGNESNNHIILMDKIGKYTVLFELLATGTLSDINSHVNKVPEYMKFVSATEGWLIHFTCQDDFAPVEQSQDVLSKGVNVLHFVHDLAWTRVVVYGYWKDQTGCVRTVAERVVVGNVK